MENSGSLLWKTDTWVETWMMGRLATQGPENVFLGEDNNARALQREWPCHILGTNRSTVRQESRECQARSKWCLSNLSPVYSSEALKSLSTLKHVWETPGSGLSWGLKGKAHVYQQSTSVSWELQLTAAEAEAQKGTYAGQWPSWSVIAPTE